MPATALPTAILGRTDLEVTRLGYGAAHRRALTDDEIGNMLNRVLDAGINFIDTANDYGNSEEMIGRYIRSRRDEYVLATKCGCHPRDGHIWTRENLERGLHESLARLRVDSVDIMQLHNPSVAACEEGELVQCLEDMRSQGYVRWIGVSSTLPHLPTFLEWGVFDVFQIPYSLLETEHEESISQVARANAGTIIRGGVALGEPGYGTSTDQAWEAVQNGLLDDLTAPGESRTALMLRLTLVHPGLHTTIVGTTNPDHLDENVKAALAGPLPEDVVTEARNRLGLGAGPA
ncbi:MAG: aldo/keto reductase [Caldilineaceae bacterium SB0662_bin_9]|uniref:Aldo/keto reductase n=1 Tax=Caldilineaceae bacterium SB0662_bin_9 TaxID=2605258 RepID=A0A6B1DX32_9CHLR|nr:aldo/keto reductase [Caldilineaceae bacterium SB0662_bin_9]